MSMGLSNQISWNSCQKGLFLKSHPVPTLPTVCKRSMRRMESLKAFAPGFPIGGSNTNKTALELWSEGVADCEASCGFVPDGAVVLVPFGKQPLKREERLEELEAGVSLSEDAATFVGGYPFEEITMVVDSPVVSGKHARIEGIQKEEGSAKTILGGLFGEKEVKMNYFITDLNSTNGTFVNRGRLRPMFPVEIQPGDVVAFGSLANAYRVVKAQARKGFVW